MPARGVLRHLIPATALLTALLAVLVVAPGAADAAREARRTYAIGLRSATVVDAGRSTPAVPALGLAGAPTRTLPVTIWYPATGRVRADPVSAAAPARGPFPLIVWAHGNGARGSDAPALVRSWASQGYVVVAPDFPVSSRARTNLDAVDDWAAQPGDVGFVIDRMRRRGGIAGLGRAVDDEHVGVAGHSLGAMTVLAVGFGAHAEPRVDAVVTFAGIPVLDDTDVGSRPIPLLLVHGDDDPTIPVEQSRAMFATATGPHYLVTVAGGGHSAHLQSPDAATEKTLAAATAAFWDAHLGGGRDPGDRIAALASPGRFAVEIGPATTVQAANRGAKPDRHSQ